jgi:hypothetical protein
MNHADSVLFQRIYDHHITSLGLTSTGQSHPSPSPRLPELDERIINQRMSSSVSPVSGRKLKRSKTMHSSSLTSVSEPGASSRVKRARSMKAASTSTDITNPAMPAENPDARDGMEREEGVRDVWEFPESSPPQIAPGPVGILKKRMLAKVNAAKADVMREEDIYDFPETSAALMTSVAAKSGNLEKTSGALKAHGKVRRTKTMGAPSSSPRFEEPKRRAVDDNEMAGQGKRKVDGLLDDDEICELPTLKRFQRGSRANADTLPGATMTPSGKTDVGSDAFRMIPSQDMNRVVGVPDTVAISQTCSIEVPRTVSQEIRAQLGVSHIAISADSNNTISSTEAVSIVKGTESDKSSLNHLPSHDETPTKPIILDDPQTCKDGQENISSIKATDSDILSSLTHSVDKGPTSMVIMPNILTSSEKNEYKVVNVTSSSDMHQYSLPEMMEPAKALQLTDASSTIPNDTPRPNRQDEHSNFELRAPTVEPLSSPPINLSSIRMKRSRTDVGLRSSQHTHPSSPPDTPVHPSSSASKTAKRKLTRSKTIGHSSREASVDELALSQPHVAFSPIHAQTITTFEPPKDPDPIPISPIAAPKPAKRKAPEVELPSSQEIGLPRELYQPRLSARRSKSMSAQADIIASGKFAEGLPVVKRRRGKAKEVTEKEKGVGEESNVAEVVSKPKESVEKREIRASGQDLVGILEQAPELASLQDNGQIPDMGGDAFEKPSLPLFPIEEPAIAQPKPHGRPPRKPSTATTTTKSVPDAQHEQSQHEEIAQQPKRRARPPKAAPSKSAPIIGDSDAETEDETASETAVLGPRRTDRGAAEKQAKPKEIIGSDADEAIDTIQPDPKPRGRPRKVPAEKSVPPAEISMGKEVRRHAAQSGPTSTPPPDTPRKPTTPQQQQVRGGMATPHSPLQSGKVPYRVGLSRRMRIAPLLKVIRK